MDFAGLFSYLSISRTRGTDYCECLSKLCLLSVLGDISFNESLAFKLSKFNLRTLAFIRKIAITVVYDVSCQITVVYVAMSMFYYLYLELPSAVLQPSLSAEHHHFNIVSSLLFGTFILDYISRCHTYTYHTILQMPELNRH